MSNELRDEQQFLLNSLRDLEKERAAGDIDDNDYTALREGYVARTAAITRELQGAEAKASTQSQSWVRRVLVAVCVLAVAVGAGVLVAQSSGQRLPGESATGGIEQSTANILATARQLNFSDPSTSIQLYTQVLKVEPDNVEALTYRSWLLALTAREAEASVKQLALATAVADLLRAQKADPEYPDAHCFLGIVYFRFLEQASLAKKQLDVCVAMNPPASVASFVGAITKEVDAAVARGQ
jgi:tetratricopeptide (TPR) repeat protein